MPNPIINEMIKVAAKEANINDEQSKICVEATLNFINHIVQEKGVLDLSDIFPGAYVRVGTHKPYLM